MSVYRVSSNKSSVNNFPTVRPTLDLDFANSKTLDPRITFTRSSGGSYVGADGLIKLAGVNEARFDHDPTTGESLGLLVEEARTNLVLYSEQYDFNTGNSFTSWNQPGPAGGVIVTPNIITSPNGNQTADFVDNGGIAVSLVENARSVIPSSTTEHYATIYAKKGTANGFTFNCYYNLNTEDNVDFNFNTGVVSGVPNPGEYIFQNVGNGWYKCGFRISRDITGTRNTLLFRLWPSVRTQTSGGTYFWGAQLEVGAFPTSYIPTEGSTRTRAADNASITGKNFSEWYNPTESTFFTSFRPAFNASATVPGRTPHVLQAGNATTVNDNYTIRGSESNTYWSVLIRSASPSSLQFPGFNPYPYLNSSTQYKAALSVNSSLISVSLNGLLNADSANTTTVNHTTPFNKLFIGSGTGGGPPYELTGHIAQLTYYPKRLPNAQLQALTK